MQLRTANESSSKSSYALIAIPLAAIVTFVVGYTASRATLSQTESQNNVVTEDYNLVIPHQATLWSDLGG